ncbi:hypothetical protein KM043_015178 [Ampulex compressa]|nr:hypothetical protein KM043_015178 [Ampulex compressa]
MPWYINILSYGYPFLAKYINNKLPGGVLRNLCSPGFLAFFSNIKGPAAAITRKEKRDGNGRALKSPRADWRRF